MTINIYDYLDYREFLRVFFASKKAEGGHFSTAASPSTSNLRRRATCSS